VGHFPNVTHAQGVIGTRCRAPEGLVRAAPRPGREIEWYVYNAGPSAMEALLAGSIDLTYVGPNPALNAYIRSEGDEVRILAGAASGGAALVVQPDGRIQKDADFKGKRIGRRSSATRRTWPRAPVLKSKGYKVTQTGGDALVLPTANPISSRSSRRATWTRCGRSSRG
jgi:NitT/TauT family transport system substrate-binding protein